MKFDEVLRRFVEFFEDAGTHDVDLANPSRWFAGTLASSPALHSCPEHLIAMKVHKIYDELEKERR